MPIAMRYRHRQHLLWLLDVVLTSVSWVAASTALRTEILPPADKFLDSCEPLNLKCVVTSSTNVKVALSFCPEYPKNALCRELTDAGPVTLWSPETNSTSIRLDIRRVAKQKHEGKYNCVVDGRIMKAVYVMINDAPPVTSIGVVANDMDNFEIRWCVNETVNDSHCWQASWVEGADSGEMCNMTSVGNLCYTCKSSMSPLAYYALTVSSCQLTSQSAIQSSVTETIMPYCYVKPNPVDNLKAVTINSTAISLSWSPHNTKITAPLIYRITYYSLQPPSNKTVIEVTKNLVVSNELHEVIDGLEPNTTYYFTMVSKEIDFGFWSDQIAEPIAAKTALPTAVESDEKGHDKGVPTAVFIACVVGVVVAIPVIVVVNVRLCSHRGQRLHLCDLIKIWWGVHISVPVLAEDPENPYRQEDHVTYEEDNAYARVHQREALPPSVLPWLQGGIPSQSEQQILLDDHVSDPTLGPCTETSDLSSDISGDYTQADVRTHSPNSSLNSEAETGAMSVKMQQLPSTSSTAATNSTESPRRLPDLAISSDQVVDESCSNDDNENDNETENDRFNGTADQDQEENSPCDYCKTKKIFQNLGNYPSAPHYEEDSTEDTTTTNLSPANDDAISTAVDE